MSASSVVGAETPTDSIMLHVTADDEAAEIFVMNANFKRLASARGKMDIALQPGVYKLKVRAGTEIREEFLVLVPTQTEVRRHFNLISFVSPAPLENTLKTHEFHIDNAACESRKTHVQVGAGSSVFVFVRDWTGETPTTNPLGYSHPATGLFLCDLNGNVLVDFSEQSVVDRRADPWSACNVSVDPGAYRLRLLRPRSVNEQTIVACKGWQTQIFALQRECGKEGREKCANLSQAAVFLAKPEVGFVPSDRGQRLSELARLGLSNRRMVLSDNQLEELLHGKFQDPMLGIYGAHLLIMSKALNLEVSLREIVANLRRLLITPHPDVEGLALKLGDQTSGYTFSAPPMLSRSWTLILEASVRQPELVPLGSLADRATDHLLGEEPWLISWMDREEAHTPADSDEGARIPNTKELVKSYLQELSLPRRVRAKGARASVPRPLTAVALGSEPTKSARAKPWWPTKIAPTEIKYLVETLRIPRARLESILTELTGSGKEQQATVATFSDSVGKAKH